MSATFSRSGDRYVLSLERVLAHPPDRVWRALTERELLKQWFPCDVEGVWEVGQPLTFTFLHGEGDGLPEDQLRGEVLTVDEPRLLEFRWGDSHFRCELTPDDVGTRLSFSESLTDPSWGARNAAGWELCLDNIELVLQGATVGKFVMDSWRTLYRRYVAKFEPEFGPQLDAPEDHPGVEQEGGA